MLLHHFAYVVCTLMLVISSLLLLWPCLKVNQMQYITSITKLSNCCILRMFVHEMTRQQVCDIVYSLCVLEIP